jgi:tetratricopeptide (TPR) repeat protein
MGAYSVALVDRLRGDYEDAIAHLERAQHAARASGFAMFEVADISSLGAVYVEISPTLADRAAELHRKALVLLDDPTGAPAGGEARTAIGFSFLRLGEIDRAAETFQQGLTLPSINRLVQRPWFLIGQALVALERHQPDQAAAWLKEARAFVDERAMRHLVPLLELAEARLDVARHQPERAVERLTHAAAAAQEMGMRPLAWQTRAEAAAVLDGCGRSDEAAAVRREAQAIVDEIAALFQNDEWRALFLQAAAAKLAGSPVPATAAAAKTAATTTSTTPAPVAAP